MDDKDIEYAVKAYQRKHTAGSYCCEEFAEDIKAHLARRPCPHNYYDPFMATMQINSLWEMLTMSMREIVEYSKLDMANFSRRFCIPYRTLQAWCDGTDSCPIYVKLMLGEILHIYSRTASVSSVSIDLNGGYHA